MIIRRIRADEGALLKDLRLRALADAPHAFAQTLSDALQDDDEAWGARARRAAVSQTNSYFVAQRGAHGCGLVGAFVAADEEVELFSLWVDPEVRRRGIGAALVEAVVVWAASRGARGVGLHVNAANTDARGLYRSLGFADRRMPDGNHPGEVGMWLGMGPRGRGAGAGNGGVG